VIRGFFYGTASPCPVPRLALALFVDQTWTPSAIPIIASWTRQMLATDRESPGRPRARHREAAHADGSRRQQAQSLDIRFDPLSSSSFRIRPLCVGGAARLLEGPLPDSRQIEMMPVSLRAADVRLPDRNALVPGIATRQGNRGPVGCADQQDRLCSLGPVRFAVLRRANDRMPQVALWHDGKANPRFGRDG